MAYNGYHSPQPYEHQAGLNNHNTGGSSDNDNNAYGNPPPPPPPQPPQQQQQFFQLPYPDHYDLEPRVPSQPQQHVAGAPPQPPLQPPLQPPPPSSHPPLNTAPEAFPDQSRFYQTQTSPINQAANAAFQSSAAAGGAVPGGSSPYLPPEVLSQITATVIQQLRGTSLESSPIQQQPQQQPSQHPQQQQQQPPPIPQQMHPPQNPEMSPFPPSVSTQSDYSPSTANPKVYTPPSPYKSPQDQLYPGQPQYAPSNRGTRRPSPEPERPSRSPYGGTERPRPARHPTKDETTMERIWGHLFDRDGKPTQRLGQFLRGIAIHLIEDYPPGNTIVIRPEKMQKYYQDTSVPGDNYPWIDIFDDRTSSISRLYRDVQAEHHLVQDLLDEKPDIPSLTPRGFERWMTLMIQAHPDQEFERLQLTLLEMPINNPDQRTERFPKELSRRLFPKSGDQTIKDLLEQGMINHCKIKPSVFASQNSPQPGTRDNRGSSSAGAGAPTSSAPSPLSFEPRRNRYSASVEDDPEDSIPSRPIERERKPYSAQPGNGKAYNDSSRSRVASPIDIPVDNYRNSGSQNDWVRSPSNSLGGYKHSADEHTSRVLHDRGLYGSSIPPGGFPDDLDSMGYHEPPRETGRNEDRAYDSGRERGKRRYHEHPSRGGWDNDEDYYRSTGLLGGRGGGPREPYDDDPTWPRRY